MFARCGSFSLAATFIVGAVVGLDLKSDNQDSIKSVAKTLANGIVETYKSNLEDSKVPGLFGDDYYWWEAGAIWNTLLEYSYLTGDTQFNGLVSDAMRHQIGDHHAFMPMNQSKTLGNDDQSFWGLAAMTAAEIGLESPQGENASWADIAANVFNTQVLRWDTNSCDGGLKWQIFSFNNGYDYKNTISNANFFLLSARLAQFTGNKSYSDWAEKAFDWTLEVGLMSEDYHTFDGASDVQNCSSVNKIQWSYNSGIFTEGSAILYNITNGADKWKSAVTGFVDASSVFVHDSTGTLYEVACESNGKCNTDQKAFKGIATRSFARAAVAAPFVSSDLQLLLSKSAKAASDACDGEKEDLECALRWTEDDMKVKVSGGGLGEAFSALSVVQGLLWPQAKGLTMGNATGNGTGSEGSSTGTNSSNPANSSGGAAPISTGNAAGRNVASFGFGLSSTLIVLLCL